MDYVRLCQAARKLGLHVELHASTPHKKKIGSQTLLYRDIILMRLTYDGGKVYMEETMGGIGDRDRAARVLLGYVRR